MHAALICVTKRCRARFGRGLRRSTSSRRRAEASLGLAGGLLLLLLLLLPTAIEAADVPSFAYDDASLTLRIPGTRGDPVTIEWIAVDVDGRRMGTPARREILETPKDARILLPVGPGPGHHVTLTLRGRTQAIWANRGIWYALPKRVAIEHASRTTAASKLASRTDIVLAHGIAAHAEGMPQGAHLEVGRTLGADLGRGVETGDNDALVLVARGNVGAVVVTTAHRIDRAQMLYRDYPINVEPSFRRWVIPLRAFRSREGEEATPRTLYSIALRSERPVSSESGIDVDHVGLVQAAPGILGVARDAKGVQVRIETRGARHVEVRVADLDGHVRVPVAPDENGIALIGDLRGRARRVWACYEDEDGVRACDPPDAPHTSHAIPPRPEDKVVIDDFSSIASVNSFRLPTATFTSSEGASRDALVTRQRHAIVLEYPPGEAGGYAGYITPLPPGIAGTYRSLEIAVRGTVHPSAVKVGARDETGREPKIDLASYCDHLGREFRRVLIPLEAFRGARVGFAALSERDSRIAALTIALEGPERPVTKEGGHRLELRSIALVPEIAPLVVSSFSSANFETTALGGKVAFEVAHGARIDRRTAFREGGGPALGIDVSAVGGRAYALVAFGLGGLDVHRHRAVTLWIRGARGGESAALYLGDGNVRRKVELSRHVAVTTEWRHVRIPFSAFGRDLSTRALKDLVLAWEDRPITREAVDVDDVRFE